MLTEPQHPADTHTRLKHVLLVDGDGNLIKPQRSPVQRNELAAARMGQSPSSAIEPSPDFASVQERGLPAFDAVLPVVSQFAFRDAGALQLGPQLLALRDAAGGGLWVQRSASSRIAVDSHWSSVRACTRRCSARHGPRLQRLRKSHRFVKVTAVPADRLGVKVGSHAPTTP